MVKFILIGHERCGSTLVEQSLAAHRNIHMFGELFHNEEFERRRTFRARTYRPSEKPEDARFYRDGEDGATFLREAVFYEHHWSVWQAVGFKIFYHHARQNDAARSAWQYLLADKRLRVIHLQRRNLLETYQSLQVAVRTNDWARFKSEKPRPVKAVKPFSLNPAACEAYFNQMTAYQQWVKRSFRFHPMIEIEYERDVCGRYQETMYDIHAFLGVPGKRARRLLEKQARRKPPDQISNYAALKAYFRYTLYNDFFTFD